MFRHKVPSAFQEKQPLEPSAPPDEMDGSVGFRGFVERKFLEYCGRLSLLQGHHLCCVCRPACYLCSEHLQIKPYLDFHRGQVRFVSCNL